MMQYPLLKFQLMDKLFQAPCINEIFIYQIVCIPVWRNQLFPRCKNRQQLNYDMMAHISSLLCSIECGDILFARQTTRGMETPTCGQTNIFFSKLKIQSRVVNQFVFNFPPWVHLIWLENNHQLALYFPPNKPTCFFSENSVSCIKSRS